MAAILWFLSNLCHVQMPTLLSKIKNSEKIFCLREDRILCYKKVAQELDRKGVMKDSRLCRGPDYRR
jgi:hypothetical protein